MKSARILAFSAFAIRTVRALAALRDASVEPEAIRRGGHDTRHWPQRPRTYYPTTYPTGYPTDYPTDYPTYSPISGAGSSDESSGDDEMTRSTPAPSSGEPEDGPCPLCSYAIATAAAPGSGPVESLPVESVPAIATTTTAATPASTATTATTTAMEAVGAEAPNCPNALTDSVTIDSNATLYYAVVPPASYGSNDGLLCGRLEARNGDGWIGIAVSANGRTVGSEAIIGVPSDGSVRKYDLVGRGPGGVVPMSDERQTLRDVSVRAEDDGTTVMEFAKLLVESMEIPILQEGANTFLYAMGGDALEFPSGGWLGFEVDLGAGTSPGYDAFDFTSLGPFNAGDPKEDPTSENPADEIEVDPVIVNGLEFRPSSVVEATANGASSGGFAIVVVIVPLFMSVLSSMR